MSSGPSSALELEQRRSRFFHVPQAAASSSAALSTQQATHSASSVPFSQLAQAYLRKSQAESSANQWSNPLVKTPSSFASYSSYQAHTAYKLPEKPLPRTDLDTLDRVYRYHAKRNVISGVRLEEELKRREKKEKEKAKRKERKKRRKNGASTDVEMQEPDENQASAALISSTRSTADVKAIFVEYFPGTAREYTEEVISPPRPPPSSLSPKLVPMDIEDLIELGSAPSRWIRAPAPQRVLRSGNALGINGINYSPNAASTSQVPRQSSKDFFTAVLERRTRQRNDIHSFQPRAGPSSNMYFLPPR